MNEKIDEIINKYSDMIYRISFLYLNNRTDAEDVVQEVFIRYLKNQSKIKDEEHEKNWLIRVTLNLCHNIKNSAWKRKIVPLEKCTLKFETEIQNEIYSVLDKLKDKYRVVIQLFYFEDLSVSQISKILKISESNVKTRLKRAREMLEIELKKGDN